MIAIALATIAGYIIYALFGKLVMEPLINRAEPSGGEDEDEELTPTSGGARPTKHEFKEGVCIKCGWTTEMAGRLFKKFGADCSGSRNSDT